MTISKRLKNLIAGVLCAAIITGVFSLQGFAESSNESSNKKTRSSLNAMYYYNTSIVLDELCIARGWDLDLFWERQWTDNGKTYARKDSCYQVDAYKHAIESSIKQLEEAGYTIDTSQDYAASSIYSVNESAEKNPLSKKAAEYVGQVSTFRTPCEFITYCAAYSDINYIQNETFIDTTKAKELYNYLTQRKNFKSYQFKNASCWDGRQPVNVGDLVFFQNGATYYSVGVVSAVKSNILEVIQANIVQNDSLGHKVTVVAAYKYTSPSAVNGRIVHINYPNN